MLSIAQDDDLLAGLVGSELPSEIAGGVVYRIEAPLGHGGMSVAFLASRVAAESSCPVVLKIVRPSVARRYGSVVRMLVQKEAVSLGRLNERVPPTPFVVRFIDAGSSAVTQDGRRFDLPWIVVEHVRGGLPGTTLTERLAHGLRETGHAFDPARAARAIEHIAAGLAAVHEVGVVHRDVKPDNVLCCGWARDELFKLADFGVARPEGVDGTFNAHVLGTPGYAAPELVAGQGGSIGPSTDVFGLAAVAFYILTGEHYLQAGSPIDAVVLARSEHRRRLVDAPRLHPWLRARPDVCGAIDGALAFATTFRSEARTASAVLLSAALVPWLRVAAPEEVQKPQTILMVEPAPEKRPRWAWTVRAPADPDLHIRSVAWDVDGRCLAATSRGLAFWDLHAWRSVPDEGLQVARNASFVRRLGVRRWLVGGGGATLASFTAEGVADVRRGEDASLRYVDVSGDLDDLAVAVAAEPDEPAALHALVGGRWLKPLPLADVAIVADLARVEDDRWLIAGRGTDGEAFLGVYAPLAWALTRIAAPGVRALVTCAGEPALGEGLAAGTDSVVLRYARGTLERDQVGAPGSALSAAAIDPGGVAWVASAGAIWTRSPASSWTQVWSDPSQTAPIIALAATGDAVLAATADGAVLEGRAI